MLYIYSFHVIPDPIIPHLQNTSKYRDSWSAMMTHDDGLNGISSKDHFGSPYLAPENDTPYFLNT